MPERDTPQGTATPTPAPADVENTILDSALFGDPDDDDDDQDTPEQPPEKPSEVSDEDDEEDDESSDDEGDAEEEDPDQPRDEKGRFISKDARVKTDDGEEVTVEELLKGRLRQSDYTRKTQATAEEKRLAAEERNRAVQQLQQFKEAGEFTLQVLQARMPKEPDQALLDRNSPSWDPIRYQEEWARYDSARREIQQVFEKVQSASAEAHNNLVKELQEKRQEEETKLFEALPDLKDEKKGRAIIQKMIRAGSKVGFSAGNIQNTTDHRVFLLLDAAAKWFDLEAQKGKATEAVKGKPPMVQGRRQDPKAVKGRQEKKAWEVLQATGGRGKDGDAAANLLLDKLIN